MPPAVVAGVDPAAVLLTARDAAWSAWACLRCRRGVVLLSAEASVGVLAGLALAFRAGGTCADACVDKRLAGALFSRGISSGITVFR